MKTVLLIKPLKQGENEITEVTLREPTTGELRGLEMFQILRMDVNAHRTLVPRLSKLSANEFDMLAPRDLLKVQEEIVGFFTE